MELFEIVEPFVLDYMIDEYSNFAELEKYNDTQKIKIYKDLRTYKSKVKNEKVKVSYREGGVNAGGRTWAKGVSLQNFPRLIRNTLAEKNYIDIDLENNSFSIINNYLIKNDLPNKAVNDYIDNREERLSDIMMKYNVERDEAKKMMIFIANSNPNMELIGFMNEIKKELRCFVNHIENNDPEFIKQMKQLKISKSSKTSDYGSIITYFYQQIERDIIKEAVKFCESHSYKVGCVIHDGFLLENKNLKEINNFLECLNSHIKQKLNENVKFTKKDFKEKLDIPKEIIEMNAHSFLNQEKKSYGELKFKFEESYFKILNPPCFVNRDCEGEIHKTKISDMVRNHIDWKEAGIKKFNLFVDTEKPKTFIENYIRDPFKREYQKLGFYFDKSLCPPHIFNTFNGFDFEAIYPQNENEEFTEKHYKGLQTIKEFYKYIVDDNSEKVDEYYDYIMQYFSHIIFNPMKKTKIHICLKGDEGCGKNLSFEFIGKILLGSQYYLETSNPRRDIFGDFNSIREKKKLIVFNEADPDETKFFYEQLKDTTTNEEVLVKEKFFNDRVVKSYEEIGSTTNNEIPIKISDSNRRFVLFECKQEKKSFEEFGELYFDKSSIMKNQKVQILFLDYLKSIFNPKYNFSKFPKSNFYERSLEYSKNNIYEYFKYLGGYFDSNNKLDFFSYKKNDIIEILQTKFISSYKSFMELNGFSDILTNKGFKLEITKHHIFNTKHSNKGKLYYFNKEEFISFLKSKDIYEKMEFIDDETDSDEEKNVYNK